MKLDKNDYFTYKVKKKEYLQSILNELEKEIRIYLAGYNTLLDKDAVLVNPITLPLKIIFTIMESYSRDIHGYSHPSKYVKEHLKINDSDTFWKSFRDGVMHYNNPKHIKKKPYVILGMSNDYSDKSTLRKGHPIWKKSDRKDSTYHELCIDRLYYEFKLDIENEISKTDDTEELNLSRPLI